MPSDGPDQDKRSSGGTLYRASARLRPPLDRQLRIALAVGVTGVTIGALLASGALSRGDPAVRARWMEPTGSGTAGPGGTAAGYPSPAAPTPSAPASPGALPPHPASPGGPAPGGSAPGAPSGATSPGGPLPGAASPGGPPLTGGVRQFRSVAGPGCLGVPAGEVSGAYPVDCAGDARRWLAAPAYRDVVALVSVASGRCLAVDHPDVGPGTPVRQHPCDGGTHQQWRLVPAGAGAIALTNVHSGRCAALPDPATADAPVRQLACRGTLDQLWYEQPAAPTG